MGVIPLLDMEWQTTREQTCVEMHFQKPQPPSLSSPSEAQERWPKRAHEGPAASGTARKTELLTPISPHAGLFH